MPEELCDVKNCNKPVKRSLSRKKVSKALPELKFKNESKKAHLCKEHYKEYKKKTKKERTLERLGWE